MTLALMFAAAAISCHPVERDRILGSDLAAASTMFVSLRPDLVIANSPRPGTRRLFEPAELLRIARANNLDAAGVTPLCFARPTAPLQPELVVSAMRRSLGAPRAGVEILALSKYPVPHGELVFPRDALQEPVSGDSVVWNGYVAYDGGHFSIWAKVRLTVLQTQVVCAVDLMPGHVVKASDLRVEMNNVFPRRLAPLTNTEGVVGLLARRSIPAGSILTTAMFTPPNDVERGQIVQVEVQSGATVVRVDATAESAGRRGDTVAVRNATSGKVFRAHVEGKRRVSINCRSRSEVPE